MPAPVDCAEGVSWQALFADTVPPEERERSQRHLEACPVCQARLERAAQDEEYLLDLARRVGDPTVAPADATLAQLVNHLLDAPPAGRTAPGEPAGLYFLRPSDRPDLLGTLGAYEVQEVIGQGGMAIVLRAFEPALHRFVAIKVLAPALAGSATARRRFTREALAAAAVSHEHIVAVHGVYEGEGLPYLVMQYVAGESLQRRLDRAGPLDAEEVVRIGAEVASGLAAAHARGLIHRDIKPANILLERRSHKRPAGELPAEPASGPVAAMEDAVKLTDFGLARAVDDVGLTQPGVVAGTPEYMAPEQARGEPIEHRADLYALGAVLYACCTGEPPFRGETPVAVLRRVSDDAPPAVRALNPAVPAWLEAVIGRLLAKDPAERFQSAAEVAALLEGCLAHLRQASAVAAPHLPPSPAAPHPASAGARAARKSGRWRPAPLVASSLVLSAGFLLLALQAAGPVNYGTPPDCYYDFRGRPLPPELTVFGDNRFLQFEPEGLRITLPKDREDLEGVCIARDFEAVGDFEFTSTFEILHAETPPPSYGVGASLFVRKAPPLKASAAVCRLVRANGQQLVLWDQALEVPERGVKLETASGGFPCTDTVGRLRLKRTGTTVHCLWAPGTAGEDFREIHRCEFGPEPVGRVVVSGGTGRKPCALDVRILDLRLRVAPVAGLRPAAAPPSGSGKVWLVLALVIPLAVGVGLAVRRGRRPAAARPKPAAGTATVGFVCSGCGRGLRVGPDLVGKKVKCPRCGQPTRVPGAAGGESAAAPR
jgi:serine/threonine-protein kinase